VKILFKLQMQVACVDVAPVFTPRPHEIDLRFATANCLCHGEFHCEDDTSVVWVWMKPLLLS